MFPRNQVCADYLPICREQGLLAYRGNHLATMHSVGDGREDSFGRRLSRLVDGYIDLTSPRIAPIDREPLQYEPRRPMNIRADRFLRPASPKQGFAERLRLRRIRREMTFAAERGATYHVWWHPHNFGRNLASNLDFLASVLRHFAQLAESQGMRSATMREAALLDRAFEPAVASDLKVHR